jgi:hypothetical protein
MVNFFLLSANYTLCAFVIKKMNIKIFKRKVIRYLSL